MRYLIAAIIVLCAAMSWGAQFSSEWMTQTTGRTLGVWGGAADSLRYDDNLRATQSGTSADSFCVFGFYPMIPSDATIDSILVRVDGNASSGTAAKRIISVSLTKDSGATKCSDIVADTLNQTTDALSTISSGSNTMTNAKWACTATLAQMVSRGFGVIIKKASTSVNIDAIDYVQLRIVWSSSTAHYMTYGRGANECTDTYLKQNGATTNFSTDTAMNVGSTTGNGDARVAVYNFGKPAKDSIASRTVIKAYLQIHTYAGSNPVKSDSIQFNVLQRLDASISQMTYNVFKTANNWTTAGAFSTASDIYSSLSLGDSSWFLGSNRECRIDITELLQSIDESNTDSVYFAMRDLTTSVGGIIVSSSSADASTVAWRPFLRILTGNAWPGASGTNHRKKIIEAYRNRRNP